MSRTLLGIFLVVALAVVVIVLVLRRAPDRTTPQQPVSTSRSVESQPRADTPQQHQTVIPALPALTTPQSATHPNAAMAGNYERYVKEMLSYGTMPAIDPQTHPQAASVVEAMKTGKYPERLSPIILPKAFNVEEYRKDPSTILNISAPGRVFQPAQPSDKTPPIRRITPMSHRMKQGDRLVLAVQVPAGDPVTWTSMDGGRFVETTLPTVTVAANDQGVAQATFEATTGIIDRVNILCSCLTTSGQLRYSIWVEKAPAALRTTATNANLLQP